MHQAYLLCHQVHLISQPTTKLEQILLDVWVAETVLLLWGAGCPEYMNLEKVADDLFTAYPNFRRLMSSPSKHINWRQRRSCSASGASSTQHFVVQTVQSSGSMSVTSSCHMGERWLGRDTTIFWEVTCVVLTVVFDAQLLDLQDVMLFLWTNFKLYFISTIKARYFSFSSRSQQTCIHFYGSRCSLMHTKFNASRVIRSTQHMIGYHHC